MPSSTPHPIARTATLNSRSATHASAGAASAGRLPAQQPARRQSWAGQTPAQILDRLRPGQTQPLKVLQVLIELFNTQHTALQKTVSHKTRHDRAQFLHRFFRDLHEKAGFKLLPDPRNLGQKHVRAMVRVWQDEHLAPATIQTYLSFLRGLASWLGKPGLVRVPAYYGLEPDQYERHEAARRDHSWSAQGVDIDAVITKIAAFDPYVGASLGLIKALGLRRKESILFRPYQSVVAFEATALPPEARVAEHYVRIKGKGGRVRFIPLDRVERVAAVEAAQRIVASRDAHTGNPANDLKRNLRRFDYVLAKFGVTLDQLGVTAHGLRHEVLIDHYQALAGVAPPIRGGGVVDRRADLDARKAVSQLAGHARVRASSAYLGQSAVVRSKSQDRPTDAEPDGPIST